MRKWSSLPKSAIPPYLSSMRVLLIALFLFPVLLFAQLSGKVVGVHDGDTFTLLTKDTIQVKVRLHGIDCPELKQDFGQKAKQFTSSKIFGKTITVQSKGKDRYGRVLGIVKLSDGSVLNELLLSNGLAWHYKKYDSNAAWAQLEVKARQAKAGLWAMPNPVAPWDWRKK